ncbi:unnamed protein product [Rotaria sp. Silwood2]|nr:unnamed protein product [Rotaria sp. Silwood2]
MPSNEPSLISISMQNKNNCQNESLKQYQKEIGDYKRDILMETLKNYETIIEENKYLYQQELFQFEYGLSKHIYQINDLMNYLNDYLNHRTDRIIPEIRDKQAIFRMKLKYPRHCQIKNFSEHLQRLFNEGYTRSLSYLKQYRIRKDIKLIHSIRHKLRQTHSIICVTDKSGVFHVGSSIDYDIKPGTPLRPIVSGMNSPTIKISKMLDELIRPLFDQYVKQTTIIYGVHLIRQLEKYINLGLLKATTYLYTFDITDLYTMLPQEGSISILKTFLLQFNHTHVRGMKIDAIESLARIALTENVFIYNNRYYRQIKGGAMGSPFTLTLANIFMWHWKQKIVEHQKFSIELCGDSYIDDIFLTSNDSIEKLTQILEDANKYHPNIKLTYDIGNSISFHDLQMTNHDGKITTSVHHKDAAEPYVVPFKSDHSRHIFENIIRAALLRALRYSSTLK